MQAFFLKLGAMLVQLGVGGGGYKNYKKYKTPITNWLGPKAVFHKNTASQKPGASERGGVSVICGA